MPPRLGLVALTLAAALLLSAATGAARNVTLVTDSAPDFTDLRSYLASITAQYASAQDKAIGVWRWSQRLRKQTSVPEEDGQEILDPILFFTSYGYTNCGIISGLDNSLWLNLGWRAHYVQLGDHTVSEASWDDGRTWHMFDNSTSFFCFNARGEVASVRDIEADPACYLERFAPEVGTNPVKDLHDQQGWRSGSDRPVEYARTLANGLDSFLPPVEILEDHLAIRWGRRYALDLRPGESYTRFFGPATTAAGGPRWYRPLHGKDVQEESGDRNIRGNGVWKFAVDLTAPGARDLVYDDSGVQWTPIGARGSGRLTFRVSAANVITSASVALRGKEFTLAVSRDAGIHWQRVPVRRKTAQLLGEVAGLTEFLVRVELRSREGWLASLDVETV
ncbi:MAG: hypothetical protein AAB368_05160, partial [bacterium]